MKRIKQMTKYIVGDYVSSNVAWFLFNIFRYYEGGASRNFPTLYGFLFDTKLLEGQLLIPLLWMFIFYLSGYYNRPFFKSRLLELFNTFCSVVIGVILIFFIALLNDVRQLELGNYSLLIALFIIQFVLVYLPRFSITQFATHKIHRGVWGFNTLIIGSGTKAASLYDEICSMKKSLGFNISGFVRVKNERHVVAPQLVVGDIEHLGPVIERLRIEEIIVALDQATDKKLHGVINTLFQYNLPIKMLPDDSEMILSRVRMSNIYGSPMIDVSTCGLSESEKNLKRVLDIFISSIAIGVLIPVYLFLALKIKIDSKGSVLYKQERLGYHKKSFMMYKFRTMIKDAESEGPALSKVNDERITPFGRFMRKYRLDELPQFWNVLKGDMSLVGPRPERPFYVDQIVERAPYYTLLYQVRPGITSWGMVKFGYAQNVDEMIKRLRYDILYLENVSLLVDLKIIIYTVKTVITGRGI